jgi:predicted transcriptional regulator
MNMTGYIKLYRQFMKWEWYTDIPCHILFEHCLLKANYEPKKWRGQNIEVGQFVTSIAHLSNETGLTTQQVRTALKKLKSTGELTSKTTSQYSIITIKNWIDYQGDNKQINKRITNEQQTNNKRITTTKESKEYKESKEKKNIDIFCNLDFEKCFKIYSENCTNLIPLSFERRAKNILEELREFLVEIDYDFSYFLNLCKKANSLEKIVNSKIDFRSMIRNHIGIINGKYEQQSKGITKETIQAAMQAYKLKKGLKGG